MKNKNPLKIFAISAATITLICTSFYFVRKSSTNRNQKVAMALGQASSSHEKSKLLAISNASTNPNSKDIPESSEPGAPKIQRINTARLLEDTQLLFTKAAEQSLNDNSESELPRSPGPQIAISDIGEVENAHDTDSEVDSMNYHGSLDQSFSTEVQEGVPAPEKLLHLLQRR